MPCLPLPVWPPQATPSSSTILVPCRKELCFRPHHHIRHYSLASDCSKSHASAEPLVLRRVTNRRIISPMKALNHRREPQPLIASGPVRLLQIVVPVQLRTSLIQVLQTVNRGAWRMRYVSPEIMERGESRGLASRSPEMACLARPALLLTRRFFGTAGKDQSSSVLRGTIDRLRHCAFTASRSENTIVSYARTHWLIQHAK